MSDNMTSLLIVGLCIAGWVLNRYLKLRMRAGNGVTAQEMAAIDQMAQLAARLEQRVITLERILDAEAPAWRSRAGEGYGAMGDRI